MVVVRLTHWIKLQNVMKIQGRKVSYVFWQIGQNKSVRIWQKIRTQYVPAGSLMILCYNLPIYLALLVKQLVGGKNTHNFATKLKWPQIKNVEKDFIFIVEVPKAWWDFFYIFNDDKANET